MNHRRPLCNIWYLGVLSASTLYPAGYEDLTRAYYARLCWRRASRCGCRGCTGDAGPSGWRTRDPNANIVADKEATAVITNSWVPRIATGIVSFFVHQRIDERQGYTTYKSASENVPYELTIVPH